MPRRQRWSRFWGYAPRSASGPQEGKARTGGKAASLTASSRRGKASAAHQAAKPRQHQAAKAATASAEEAATIEPLIFVKAQSSIGWAEITSSNARNDCNVSLDRGASTAITAIASPPRSRRPR